mgnify:CR=1 FL=1
MPSGNPSPRVIKGNGGRRLKVQDGDEDLADLQRRFTALEDEARIAPPAAQITPRSTLRSSRAKDLGRSIGVAKERVVQLKEQLAETAALEPSRTCWLPQAAEKAPAECAAWLGIGATAGCEGENRPTRSRRRRSRARGRQ